MNRGLTAGVLVATMLLHCSKSPHGLATSTSAAAVGPSPAPASVPSAPPSAEAIAQSAAVSDTPQATADRPLTPVERNKALAGIAELQGLMRRRATLGRESDEACDVRLTKDEARIEELETQIGKANMGSKTQFSGRPPWLGATVETFVVGCIGCIALDDETIDRSECQKASTALSDLAQKVKTLH